MQQRNRLQLGMALGQHRCNSSHSTYENMMTGRTSSSHMVKETMGTRGKVRELQRKTENLAEVASSRTRRKVVDKTDYLVSKQSPAKWQSFPKKTLVGEGAVVKMLYLVFTFEPFQDLHLGKSRLSQTFLIQFLFSDET